MTQGIDLVYDRLVADEVLKRGTKYERLAAIAFRQITERETVHDLRLIGRSGVAHQIDAVVGRGHRRILIEAKDYDKPVGLGTVRDFSAVVEDVEPDEAFIVTTQRFTEPAIKFAEAKRIKLAVLRPPREEDWANIVRRVVLKIVATGQVGPPKVTWQLHPEDHDKVAGDSHAGGLTETRELELSGEDGERRPFFPLLDAQLHEDYGTIPLGGEGEIGRTNAFDEATWLHAPGLPALRVEAWKWQVAVSSATEEVVVGDGAAGLVAELVLKTVDGSIHQMVTNHQVQSWVFDGKRVVPRPGVSRPSGPG